MAVVRAERVGSPGYDFLTRTRRKLSSELPDEERMSVSQGYIYPTENGIKCLDLSDEQPNNNLLCLPLV